MGAHSNYLTIESDWLNVIYLIVIAIIIVSLLLIYKFIKCIIDIHYNKKIKQIQQKNSQSNKIYQNPIDNFINNCIDEDIDEITINSLSDSSLSKKLLELYQEEL